MPFTLTRYSLTATATPRRYARGRIAITAAASVGLMAAAVMAFIIALNRPGPPVAATALPEPLPLPSFTLSGTDGEAFTRESLLGRYHLLFFGFTNCPDICPITLQQLAAARRRLAENDAGALPNIVFISVDPERDTLEAVRQYAGAFGDGVTGVRGDLAELEKLTTALGVFHARPPTGDGYAVEHSGAVIVVDDQARFSAVFSAPHEIDDFVHDWPILTADRS